MSLSGFLRVLATGLLFVSATVMAVEEADYVVTMADGRFEIRDYAPQVVAEVVVPGNREGAGSDAFDPLFDYISGGNRAQQKIAMTAPVSQQAAGEEIAMTAPVAQQRSGTDWAVSFMMPAGRTLENLPVPSNPAVKLRAIPGRRVAAVRYSGTWSEERYERFRAELEAWLDEHQLTAAGQAIWARYNPPFMPWFLRRNEILIPLTETPAGP